MFYSVLLFLLPLESPVWLSFPSFLLPFPFPPPCLFHSPFSASNSAQVSSLHLFHLFHLASPKLLPRFGRRLCRRLKNISPCSSAANPSTEIFFPKASYPVCSLGGEGKAAAAAIAAAIAWVRVGGECTHFFSSFFLIQGVDILTQSLSQTARKASKYLHFPPKKTWRVINVEEISSTDLWRRYFSFVLSGEIRSSAISGGRENSTEVVREWSLSGIVYHVFF